MTLAAQVTTADIWMLVTIFVLLLALIFLALAEMSLSQMTKPRANEIAPSSASGLSIVKSVIPCLQSAQWRAIERRDAGLAGTSQG